MNEQYLQVIWTKKCLVKNKEFPLSQAKRAYAFFERVGGMIVLRGAKYEPRFTMDVLEKPVDLWLYGVYEQRLNRFLEWLSAMLELTRELEKGEGGECRKRVKICVKKGKEFTGRFIGLIKSMVGLKKRICLKRAIPSMQLTTY